MSDVFVCNGCGNQDGMNRRVFISQSVLAAVSLALAACAAGDSTGPSLGSSQSIKVSDYSGLASVNGYALVTISGQPLAIVRTGDSTFVALSRVCPHQGGIVGKSGSGWLCPIHGAQFSLTGTWQGGQRTSSLRSYSTSYDATTGTLTIA
jgi:cytochrome b6-f complex iron-sulfur subunit